MNTAVNIVERSNDESAFFGVQRLKSGIVKQISHEFRTPLISIIGFAEMLEGHVQIDDDERIKYASYIRIEGQRLTNLIDSLVGFDSLEQTKVDLHINDYEIQEAVRNAMSLIAGTALRKCIMVSLELPSEAIILKFDREKIIHLLYQLLHNAVRFTKPCGIFNLKVETTDNHVVISIHDHGPGIPARDIPSLFHRFGLPSRPGEERQGAGGGLAIVKQIIEQHHGDIAVHSQVGEGSTFIVRIPIQ